MVAATLGPLSLALSAPWTTDLPIRHHIGLCFSRFLDTITLVSSMIKFLYTLITGRHQKSGKTASIPSIGKISYDSILQRWESDAGIIPSESNAKFIWNRDISELPDDIGVDFYKWKEQWPTHKGKILDALYEFYLHTAPDPNAGDRNTRLDLPNRKRFEDLSWLATVSLNDGEDTSKGGLTHADFTISYWVPFCWRYDECVNIEISNWCVNGITMPPEVKEFIGS